MPIIIGSAIITLCGIIAVQKIYDNAADRLFKTLTDTTITIK